MKIPGNPNLTTALQVVIALSSLYPILKSDFGENAGLTDIFLWMICIGFLVYLIGLLGNSFTEKHESIRNILTIVLSIGMVSFLFYSLAVFIQPNINCGYYESLHMNGLGHHLEKENVGQKSI